MGQSLAIGVLASALAGCSLIYNPNNLPSPSDAPADAEVIADADPTMLALMDVAPATINEGQGDGGGRAAVVVIRGENIAPDATVSITSQGGNTHFTVGTVELAADHKFIAVQIVAKVDDTIGAGQSNVLDIHVAQAGGTITKDLVGKLSITGLKELDDTFDNTAASLLPLYSRVVLTGTRAITGDKDHRATIRSASSIMVGNLSANGGAANNSTGGAGGPGGCNGGAGGGNGECGVAGGQKGGDNGDGGGGGFGAAGTTAASSNPGTGGSATGNSTISTYAGFMGITPNQAGGGGGGGATILTNAGAGGGGGGVIELTAEGDVMAGTLDANGGNGDSGANTLLDGSGGGGAGGAILVRAGGTLATGMLTAKGGNGAEKGGTGAVGRIRFDVPTVATAPGGNPGAHRAAAFVGAPLSVTTPNPTITMIGTANDGFKVYVVDHDGAIHDEQSFAFGANNMVAVTPTLFRGYNRLCVVLDGGERGRPEGEKCVDLAMLP